MLVSPSAVAQIDLSGHWADLYHEDAQERIPGPFLGDYLGIPLNNAGLLRADSWSSSIVSMREHECIPHPVTYAMRGPANIRITSEVDEQSQQIKAFHVFGTFGDEPRTIWLDGRPHPSKDAPHTWAGFSTGIWVGGDMLTVETDHIKAGYLRRNGVASTDEATVTEHFIRHGDLLTHIYIRRDPAYLSEPFIQSENWRLEPNQQMNRTKCEPTQKVARERHSVPHHLPGTNDQLTDFTREYGVPFEATRAGAEGMYPEYRKKLKSMSLYDPTQPVKYGISERLQ